MPAADIVAFQESLLGRGVTPTVPSAPRADPPLVPDLVDAPEPLHKLPLQASLRTALEQAELPTIGAVASLTRAELQREFAALTERLQKTIVFVTHDIREAFKLASRIGLFQDGRLVELSKRDEFRQSAHAEARAFMATLEED